MDYSGCGNTVNANHPDRQKFILDCLHYWVEEMHVDGFRFDEGSILHRGRRRRADGVPARRLGHRALAETLADTKVIAEPWDAGGLYDVGQLPGLALVGVERHASATTCAGSFAATRLRSSTIATRICRQRRHLPGQSARPDEQRQLHHARTTASRSTTSSPTTTSTTRRTARTTATAIDDNLSWNCGAEGDTDDPDDQRAAQPADQELRDDPAPLAGRADVRRRATRSAARSAATTTRYCQDNEIQRGSTGSSSRRTPACCASSGR